MSLKDLVDKKIKKSYEFMGQKIEITKLSVNQVFDIQEQVKEVQSREGGSERESLSLIRSVITMSVDEFGELSEDDFFSLPLDELTKLSDRIMQYSGMAGGDTGKSN